MGLKLKETEIRIKDPLRIIFKTTIVTKVTGHLGWRLKNRNYLS